MPLTPFCAADDDVGGVEEGRPGRLLGLAAVEVGVDGRRRCRSLPWPRGPFP